MTTLPSVFDLLYDIKTLDDVECIANGSPHASDADPEDLVTLFKEQGMDVPNCLSALTGYKTIWICCDKTWSEDMPLDEDIDKYRKVKISPF